MVAVEMKAMRIPAPAMPASEGVLAGAMVQVCWKVLFAILASAAPVCWRG